MASKKTLECLSHYITNFVDRSDETKQLKKAILEEDKNAVIFGSHGMGKSSLAAKFAFCEHESFEDILFLELHSYLKLEEVLRACNFFLGDSGIVEFDYILRSPIKMTDKFEALTSFLNEKRFLIIFDDYTSFGEELLNKLIEFVEKVDKTKFIFTGKHDINLNDSLHLELQGLSENDALKLIGLSNRKISYDLKKRIKEISKGRPYYLIVFSKSPRIIDKSENHTPEKILERIYENLENAAKELLKTASIFEGPVPLEILDDNFSENAVNELLEKGLLFKKDCYYIPNIVKKLIRTKIVNQRRLSARIGEYYDKLVESKKDLWDHLRAREYYMASGEYVKAYKIVESAYIALLERGYVELAVKLLEESVETLEGDKKFLAASNLASVYQRIGRESEAIKIYEEVKEFYYNKKDRRNLSAVLQNLGAIYLQEGLLEDAKNAFKESLEISKGIRDKEGMGISYHNLGSVFHALKEYTLAKEMYQRSIEISSEAGDKMGFAQSLYQLGAVLEDLGEYEEAVQKYSISAAAFNNLNHPNAELARNSIEKLKNRLERDK